MSDYYKSLNPTSRVRYVEKLSYLSLKEEEDPYDNRDKFKDDMSKWPLVEFGHIFCYYVERPGLYTSLWFLGISMKISEQSIIHLQAGYNSLKTDGIF